jgi:small-conductance mechanosensitive channel
MLNDLIGKLLLFAPRLAGSLLIFLAFCLGSILLQKLIRRLIASSKLNRDALKLLEQTATSIVWIVGIVTALGTLGIDVSALVAGLGLTGFAVGLALKDILSNFVSGALILIYRPFRRNDRISVAGFEGTVIDIDLRYTTLQAEEKKILIPNASIFTHTICVIQPNEVKIITKKMG